MRWEIEPAFVSALTKTGTVQLRGVGTVSLVAPGGRTDDDLVLPTSRVELLCLTPAPPDGFACPELPHDGVVAWQDMGLLVSLNSPGRTGRMVLFLPTSALLCALDGKPAPLRAPAATCELVETSRAWLLSGSSPWLQRSRGPTNERVVKLRGSAWADGGDEMLGLYARWPKQSLANVLFAIDRLSTELGEQRLSPADALAMIQPWRLSSEQSVEVLAALPM